MSKDNSTCARFFIDGPNIDATLGNCVLGHKPLPHERPRWDRVRDVTQCHYDADLLLRH
jgi:uncharacterized protein